MKLPNELLSGVLIKRYKRFLADVKLDSGRIVTAHCPNSGSMKGCKTPGSAVLLTYDPRPTRKLKYTWELVKADGVWVGINTMYPNKLVKEAILDGTVTELQGYEMLRPEVKYGENSRIDILLENPGQKCYIEVKNVTLIDKERALFPDAVTTRGQKHLRELMNMIREEHRSVIFFVIQREDGQSVSPADTIDPEYGQLLREAVKNGVEALAYQAIVNPEEIYLHKKIPVLL